MAAVLLKEIELTPDDIVQAVRALGPDELADLRQRLQDHGLILEWAERPGGQLIQDEGVPAERKAMTDFLQMQMQSASYQEWIGEENDVYDQVFADVQAG